MSDEKETEGERIARLVQEAEELGLKVVEELKSETEPGDPWWTGLKRLAMSGKAWVALLATIGAVAMHVHGDVAGDKTLAYIGAIVVTYLVGHALEDAAEKFRGKTAVANALHNLSGAITNQLPALLPRLLQIIENVNAARGAAPPPDAESLEDMLRGIASRPYCPDCKLVAIGDVKPGDPCDQCGKPLKVGPEAPPKES